MLLVPSLRVPALPGATMFALVALRKLLAKAILEALPLARLQVRPRVAAPMVLAAAAAAVVLAVAPMVLAAAAAAVVLAVAPMVLAVVAVAVVVASMSLLVSLLIRRPLA